MQVYSLEPLAKTMAINSIIAYQNYISPHKRFSCPHRLLHGGDSCSDYVKRMLTNQSLTEVVKSSVQRFQDCTQASKILINNGFRCIVIPCCLPL
jgi:putative component of membrane protein insertase Oxa1/YidC/SpoIIIJ protein YidD